MAWKPKKTYSTGQEIGQRLCKVFGINPDTVSEMNICIQPSGLPYVCITRHITCKEAEKIESIFEEYTVVKSDGQTGLK